MRMTTIMENFVRDFQHALRMMRKNPAFASASILVLALGIGANTAIFSVANAILFRPLLFPEPQQLVRLWDNYGTPGNLGPVSYPNFKDWRSWNHSFSGMASFYGNESGSKTASGQHFNQNAMTCAHRSLPFGTKLRVTRGDRSVIVTVNDRGPFVRGRVLDLSTGAARAIGLTSAGVGRVTAEVVS